MPQVALRRCLTLTVLSGLFLIWLGGPHPANSAATNSIEPTIHVVQQGETLDSIAQLYHISVALLASANDLGESSEVVVGDRLLIPGSPSTGIMAKDIQIVVGLQDTLEVLAARYDLTLQEIAQPNRIINPRGIFVGQTLVIEPHELSLPSVRTVVLVSAQAPFWHASLSSKTNMMSLALLNHVDSPSYVTPGTALALPRADAAKTDLLSATPWVSLDLHPLPLEAGRTDALRLTVDGKGALSATFLGHALNFLQNGSEYAAVFGVDRWTKPGVYPLTLEFKDAAGKTHTLERRILVVKGNYAREVLQLTGEAAQARADPQVVAAEQAYIVQKMGRFTPQKFWSGVFQIPTPGVLTSAFGSVRSINGSGYDSYHTGNDLAISLGTPIVAPADGTVVDTGFLDIRGLVTIIDHGAGVYTGYWHQSSVLVHPGDKVVPGQQIGTVGNTGSSTAPHLHWEMWVGGVPVDALQWVREVFP